MKIGQLRLWGMHVFFLLLIFVSLRHFLIAGDHLWTGEGARFSWSMRLRGKVCRYAFRSDLNAKWESPDFSKVTDLQVVNLEDPLFLLQFVQQTLCEQKKTVYGFVFCRSISNFPDYLIEPEVDLCQQKYQLFHHNTWIKPRPISRDDHYREWFIGTWGRNIQ